MTFQKQTKTARAGKKKARIGAAAFLLSAAFAHSAAPPDMPASSLTIHKKPEVLTVNMTVQSCTRDKHLASLFLSATNLAYTETPDQPLSPDKIEIVENAYDQTLAPVMNTMTSAFTNRMDARLLAKFKHVRPDHFEQDINRTIDSLGLFEKLQLRSAYNHTLMVIDHNMAHFTEQGMAFEDIARSILQDHFKNNASSTDIIPAAGNPEYQDQTQGIQTRLHISRAPSQLCT